MSTTGERVSATHVASRAGSETARWQLDFTVVGDNNRTDCEGDMINETGLSRTVFVASMDDKADVYFSPSGGVAFTVLWL